MSNSLENLVAAKQTAMANTPARQRLVSFFDAGSFVEIGGLMQKDDAPVELVCGYGYLQETLVYAFSQEGAIGLRHVDKMKKIYQLALKNGAPLVGIYSSNGLHLSEGTEILDGFGELLAAQNNLSGVVPQISVVVGPCISTNAMLACSADYLIMSEVGELYSFPPDDNTMNAFGSAQRAAEEGVVSVVTTTEVEALMAAKKLLSMMPVNNLSPLPMAEFVPATGAETLRTANPDDVETIVNALVDIDSAVELYSAFGSGVYGALTTMQGIPCGIVATKGTLLTSDDCVKIARLVSVWDSYGIPVVSLVNSTGIAQSQAISARDMAKVAHVYAQATTPKIALITGAAYGASYVALASRATCSDYTIAWPNAVISALTPATAVAFQEGGRISADKPRNVLEEEYKTQQASALSAAAVGVVDDVIDPAETRITLVSMLDSLGSKRVETLPKKHGNIPF